MAGIRGQAITNEIALTAATAKTVIQLVAAANHRVIMTGWGVFFDGTAPTAEPVQVEIVRETTAGTMSALTPTKGNSADDETLQTTAQHTATVEPTVTDTIDAIEVHPQQGYEKVDCYFPIPGGTRIGIRCTAPAAVNVRAKFFFEE